MSFLRRQISNLGQRMLNHHDFITRYQADKEMTELSNLRKKKEIITKLKNSREKKDEAENCRNERESLVARLKEIDKKLAVLEPKSAQLFKEQISGGIRPS